MNGQRAIVSATAFTLVTATAVAIVPAAAPDACERLREITLPRVAVTQAQTANAGGVAYCLAAATLTPTGDSDIKIEVWLPLNGWNGKFQAVGNGSWSGAINRTGLEQGLHRGYATASTDTGHTGNTASFALGHPEKLIDFAYRSAHEMTVAAKAIVAAFYGRAPRLSYWTGCSAGGRQALKEAQVFPADFDGIVAGSPGLDWSARSAQAVRVAHALQPEASRLTTETLEMLHRAVLDACDARDGLKDGLLSDPSQCDFDPSALQCKPGQTRGCLSAPQVASVQAVYASAVNPSTKREMPGLARGSELGWNYLGWTAGAQQTGLEHYRYVIFKDPGWTFDRFNPQADTFRVDEGEGTAVNATDANLEPFFQRGGKLLQYHGWSDPQISPFTSVAYYRRVVERFGADKVSRSYRLFMAPGMGHCGGGEGPNRLDALAALERWVEQDTPPDSIAATHSTNGRVDRTRPLCPYPRVAVHTGTGSIDDAANFTCASR